MTDTKAHILKQAMQLFAQKGYAGVSMRDLAKASGIGVSGVYHHFPDKKTLYLKTVQEAFSNKEQAFSEVWQSNGNARQKLELFIHRLVHLMLADKNFHRLMQRELLEADPERMALLAREVFQAQFIELMKLIQQLFPEQDMHLMSVSVIGLVCYYLEMQPLRQFLPGYQAEHEQPQIIAEHICHLLMAQTETIR